MSVTRIAVRRPVATTMAAASAFLFGLLALQDVPLDLLPDLTYPAVTVEVPFPGASPQEVESLIVRPVEDAVAVTQGLARLRSSCQAGLGRVALLFRWGTSMDLAALEVREKLQQVDLPQGAEAPRVLRFDPTLEPILRFAVRPTGEGNRGLVELRRLAEDRLKPALERLEGVAAARVRGGFEEEVRVLVRPRAAAALGVALGTIADRLASENVNLAGGVLREGRLEYRVRTVHELADVADIGGTVIAEPGGVPVRLEQVADIVRTAADRDLITRLDGREAIEVSVFKASGQNTVSVTRRVSEQLRALSAPGKLLADARVVITSDQSAFIRDALADLTQTAWTGGLLAVLVLLLFLGDLRSTLTIAFAIPVSLVATFLFMRVAGVTLNVMSLSGIALAIGMLVDNAIVVLEAVARRREAGVAGESDAEAVIAGTGLVARAVTASTITTLSVFVPVAFVEGVASRLFLDTAITLALALTTSLVASLTVIPMLAATTLLERAIAALGRAVRLVLTPLRVPFDLAWDAAAAGYPRLLTAALRRPVSVLCAALAVTAGSLSLGGRLGADFLPDIHPGLLSVEVALPRGSSLSETDRALSGLSRALSEEPGVAAVFATAGAVARPGEPDEVRESAGQLLVRLERGGSEAERTVVTAVRRLCADVPGLAAPVISRPGLVAVRTPLEVLVDGRDLDALRTASEAVAGAVEDVGGLSDVRSSARGGRPEIRVDLDRGRLAAFGLDAGSVSEVLEAAVRGRISTELVRSDRDVPVRVVLHPDARASIEDLERLVVSVGTDERGPVVLASVARIHVREGPAEIRREGQRRVAVVSAEAQGVDLAAAEEQIAARLGRLALPPGVTARLGGSANERREAFQALAFAIGLAVLLVYLVLAAQFESFVHPLVILGAVPLAAAGAVFGLWATGTPLSVVALIGGVVLAGIVVNNAILLVDRINQLGRDGAMALDQAIVQAGSERLRPIVMTTATTVLGLLPLALFPGEGAELRAPLAVTVVAGLLGSTVLTLVVVPCAYALIGGARQRPVQDSTP